MFFRTALLLLALSASQVSATSALQQRSIEFLESRQTSTSCTTICNAFTDRITNCKADATCVCSATSSASLQSCVTCAVTTAPTPAVITAAQELVDMYTETCGGMAGVPAVTIPNTGGSTSRISTTRSPTIVSVPSTTVRRSTVTDGTPPPVVTQSTFSDATSSTDVPLPTGTNGIPGIVASGGTHSYDGKQAGLVVIGAMLGVALVL